MLGSSRYTRKQTAFMCTLNFCQKKPLWSPWKTTNRKKRFSCFRESLQTRVCCWRTISSFFSVTALEPAWAVAPAHLSCQPSIQGSKTAITPSRIEYAVNPDWIELPVGGESWRESDLNFKLWVFVVGFASKFYSCFLVNKFCGNLRPHTVEDSEVGIGCFENLESDKTDEK